MAAEPMPSSSSKASASPAGDDATVTELLRQQHDQVKQLFSELESASSDGTEDVFCELRRMLAVHETAEEEVVYPVLRSTGDDGDRIADARIAEEDEAKDVLSEMEKLDPSETEFMNKAASLKQAVVAHAENEEREVFPRLESTQDAEKLRSMASHVRLAESAAPTHPHPHGPNSAAGNLAVGPFVAIADRVRDAVHSAGS